MSRRRPKTRLCATTAVYDWIGSCGRTPEQEAKDDVRHLEVMCDGLEIALKVEKSVHQVSEGTELLLFDFGGAGGGYGPNPMADETRALVRWAEDHPSGLVVIVSGFMAIRLADIEPEEEFGTMPPNVVYLHGRYGLNAHEKALKRITAWNQERIAAWRAQQPEEGK